MVGCGSPGDRDGLYTQARKLSQVKMMVLDAATLLTDRPAGDFNVRIFRNVAARKPRA